MPWTVNPDHGYLESYSTAGSIGALTNIDVDTSTPPGTDPVVPNGGDNITFTGAQVSSGTIGANVLRTASLAASTVTYQVQQSGSSAAQDTTLNGVSHFNSSHFSVANGFVSLSGGGTAIDTIITDSGAPAVAPDANGQVSFLGGEGIDVTGQGPGNTVTIAGENASDTNKGIASFDAGDFTVVNGAVSLNSTGAGQTITGDSGGALAPTGGNWNIVGGTGVSTAGAGSTLTINLANAAAATAQTVGAVTADVITVALGATAGTFTFEVRISSFESTTPAGGGYQIFGTVRTTGLAASLVGTPDKVLHEEAALLGCNADIVVSGNNAIVRVTGTAGLTVHWGANSIYTFRG